MKIINQGEDNYLKKLAIATKEFTDGKGEIPTFIVQGETKVSDGKWRVVLTKEIIDRDGEIISVDGMNTSNFELNPIMLDAHNMQGSVIENVLGKIKGLKKDRDQDGNKMLTGEPEFAPTPNGQIAKSLVEAGFVKTVSVGFGVKDYDSQSRTITSSELYEVSLVSVPANVQAVIASKGFKGEGMDLANNLEKTLKNYEDIHPKIKQYRTLFLSKEMCDQLGYTKTGDELLDIKNIYDILNIRFKSEETPPEPIKETPSVEPPKQAETITVTKEELEIMVRDLVRESLN